MGNPQILHIALAAGAIATLVYCLLSLRRDLANGETVRAGLGAIATIATLLFIAWYVVGLGLFLLMA